MAISLPSIGTAMNRTGWPWTVTWKRCSRMSWNAASGMRTAPSAPTWTGVAGDRATGGRA